MVEGATTEEVVLPEELIVGHTTVMKGDFFTEMFGNDTADIDVRALIHGYNLVDWDQGQGIYVFDEDVVKSVMVTEDADANKTYFIALADDLYYSDGSHITAWDYAFSLLLMMAPEIEQIGGKIYRAEHILGYDDYITGRYPSLTGVSVLSDYQMAITLDHEFLPYFFETGLLLCVPYPIGVIAPGCKVYDSGYGIYIGNEDPETEERLFTADLLRQTILDPETGYNSHPSVSSGPYVLTSYDGQNATFEINPFYKRHPIEIYTAEAEEESEEGGEIFLEEEETGEEEAAEPVPEGPEPEFIKKITFKLVDNNEIAKEFEDGTLHLVNKMTYGPLITELTQTESEKHLRRENYPRIGLSFLTFSYDWKTVHEKEVRQAIAWCMDRDALTEAYCGPYGMRVDGYYGIEQWEYLLVNGGLEYPVIYPQPGEAVDEKMASFPQRYARNDAEYDAMIEAWEALNLDNLTQYTVDEERANALLDEAGWVLNREGGQYQPGTDPVRCKMIDDELVALDLKMLYPAGNHIIDTIQENFIDHLNACGIQLTLVPETMENLLTAYYRESERTTDMIYLATNFHVIVDPSITYSADNEAVHAMWNNTYSDDEELYDLAVRMRKTEPGDIFTYVERWIAFQERYNEVLPTIPIYSNIYFDFFTEMLQNYHITAHVTWSQAILDAYFGLEPEEPEEEEDGMDETDGEESLDGDEDAFIFEDE